MINHTITSKRKNLLEPSGFLGKLISKSQKEEWNIPRNSKLIL